MTCDSDDDIRTTLRTTKEKLDKFNYEREEIKHDFVKT